MATDRVWELLTWYADHCTLNGAAYHTCIEALQNYEHLLGYRTDAYDTIVRCLAVLSLCLSPSQQAHSLSSLPLVLDTSSQDRLSEWSQLLGRKSYRIYSLPKNCLYGTVGRGTLSWKSSSVSQLNETHLIGCPFWEEALSEYATVDEGAIHWTSDDTMEQFYNRYFPDDIPDEWTKTEKERSHGDGLLAPRDTANLTKYARLFLSQCARLAWNARPIVRAFLEQHPIKECHPTAIVALFTPVKDTTIDWNTIIDWDTIIDWKTPLRRKYVLS